MVRRGQLYWVDLGEPRGSSPGYERPAVVIQDDDFNRTQLRTVVVALLTTNLRLAHMDGNVLLMPGSNGLKEPSVVNVTQIYTVYKSDLVDLIGILDRSQMDLVERGIRLVLALPVRP